MKNLKRYEYIEMQSRLASVIFFGLASRIRGMGYKIPFIFDKLNLFSINLPRQSKPEMPNGI